MSDTPETFTCAACGGTFMKVRSDVDAMSEYLDTFGAGSLDEGPLEVVCGPCYQRTRPQVCESVVAVIADLRPANVKAARRASHDAVIASTGRARRSGVMWHHYPAATAQADLRGDGSDLIFDEMTRAMIARAPDGLVVIATVEIDPDVEP